MPYAFSAAGWMAAPLLLFFVSCSIFTADLLAAVLKSSKCFSVGSLVEAAFGHRAKAAVNLLMITELWGYMLSSLVCTATNLVQLAGHLRVAHAVAMAAVAVYVVGLLPPRAQTKANVFSNAVFMVCCLMFVLTGVLLPVKAPVADLHFLRPDGVVTAAGIFVFSMAGHSFFPALRERMEEPNEFPRCVRQGFAAACCVYFAMAVPGYLLFGNSVQPCAVRNIGVDLSLATVPGLGWMNAVSAVGMTVKMLTLTVLCLQPMVHTLSEELLGPAWTAKRMALERVLAPVVLAVSAGVAVHFAQRIAVLLTLVGSILCMNVAFVVPALCYWKLTKEPVSPVKKLGLASLVSMGVAFAVLGALTLRAP